MASKVVVIFAFAVLIQAIAGQKGCCGTGRSGRYGGSGCGCSCGGSGSSGNVYASSINIPTSGGDFVVTSVGPISPSGIYVSSDLSLDGNLDVYGEMPFLSAVEFSGQYDTQGSGCVDYSCGTCGNVAITSVQGNSGCGCGSSCGCGCR
ncbi:chorion class high-cysteine HCB protein 12-like isoform X2 [Leguminivora glycinivorella]|uniref:chorion class high-cysteine HCB protein 12-like isoform X2 n=1 Tax=Leguminivora glycinivorella TaxID=1035111 RepID=UPI00201097BE|nr:chorion class high-cysteine HCB protein 12-like isoform X2 [Leguminivora glycinivorella]